MDADGPSLNRYEEQLYSMFKSFDVNNEEALDESAVHALCDALQLEERGAALTDTLFEKRAGRVTFERFRSGLLAVLGDEAPAAQRPPEPPPPSEADAPDLEPRFVFGSKRYGRRSRPSQAEPASPRAASASRLEATRGASRPRVRRSVSLAPDPAALEHDARIDGEGALALCRDLRMDGIDRRIVERIFEDSPTPDTTVGEFFERLDSTLARAVSGVAVAGAEADAAAARLPAERLLEEWERVGVSRPRRLLLELGFGEGSTLFGAELERALDAELRAHGGVGAEEAGDERARLLVAALAVARMRGAAARCRADAARGERDKLRADVAEANARASLLAREVDENHARIEREAKETLRRATARHAEDARRARAEAETEAERWGAERTRLEAELARRGEAETRLRAEAETLIKRSASFEERLSEATIALEAARGERARLAKRLEEAEEKARAAAEGAAREAEARAQLATLAREQRRLQDRADELAAALEAVRLAPPRPSPSAVSSASPCDANLSVELGALLEPVAKVAEADEDFKSVPVELRAIDEPIEDRMMDMKSIEKLEAKSIETVETKSTGEVDAMDGDEERERLRELVKELESALDAMRQEYEACEEYWSRKQRDERTAHDAELRAADSRLASLLAQVAAFERRLAPPPPSLHAIPEAPALEAQVAALEEENATAARVAAAKLQKAQEQLARTQRRLAALQRRRSPPPPPLPPPPPPPAAPAGCLRCRRLEAGGAAAGARALRAESAARRLAARLVAADVLVKELYVENCQLARHPP